ncbi:hypothetical protein E4U21_006441 [Claviceps maximensis]|nr:hypothetical protein E4U21_006441 [Claviceps maximensis]
MAVNAWSKRVVSKRLAKTQAEAKETGQSKSRRDKLTALHLCESDTCCSSRTFCGEYGGHGVSLVTPLKGKAKLRSIFSSNHRIASDESDEES